MKIRRKTGLCSKDDSNLKDSMPILWLHGSQQKSETNKAQTSLLRFSVGEINAAPGAYGSSILLKIMHRGRSYAKVIYSLTPWRPRRRMTTRNEDPSLNLFEVRPTSSWEGTPNHSDIALTNVFVAHASQIASERAAIWQRYSALLIAQSVMIAAITRTGNGACLATFSVAGLVLCYWWYILTNAGWTLFRHQLDEANRFVWTGRNINPITFVLASHVVEKSAHNSAHDLYDPIKLSAVGVIALFAVLYFLGVVVAILFLTGVMKEPIFV